MHLWFSLLLTLVLWWTASLYGYQQGQQAGQTAWQQQSHTLAQTVEAFGRYLHARWEQGLLDGIQQVYLGTVVIPSHTTVERSLILSVNAPALLVHGGQNIAVTESYLHACQTEAVVSMRHADQLKP